MGYGQPQASGLKLSNGREARGDNRRHNTTSSPPSPKQIKRRYASERKSFFFVFPPHRTDLPQFNRLVTRSRGRDVVVDGVDCNGLKTHKIKGYEFLKRVYSATAKRRVLVTTKKKDTR